MGNNFYNDKKRAAQMLRQNLAAKPQTVEDLHRLVLLEFGFGRRFVLEFLELHKPMLKNIDGHFQWKA